jgi:ABC-2 type transport system ATP-binding protein
VVVEASHSDKQSTLLVRTEEPIFDPAWTVTPVTLDDVVLAYLCQARDGVAPAAVGLAVAR